MKRFLAYPKVVAAILACVLLGIGFILGVLTIKFETWPYPLVSTAQRPLDAAAEHAIPPIMRTKFIDLDTASSDWKPAADHAGGSALAAYEGNLLMLESDGSIYLLDSEDISRRRLDIEVPPNGASAIMAVQFEGSDPLYKKANWHRYVDLKFHQGGLYLSYSYFSQEKRPSRLDWRVLRSMRHSRR